MARDISDIAHEISKDWVKPNYAAKPYLEAMFDLSSMNDMYGSDDARGIVLYFLNNAGQWKGPVAQRVKKELKDMLKGGGRAATSAQRVAQRYAADKKGPPNLRKSKDGLKSCATCLAYNAGACSDFADAPVQTTQVCDAWHAE